MRSLHADLTTAQVSTSATPYLTITFTKGKGGVTTYTYTTADSPNKIKALRHVEEPYNDYAILVLDNHDGLLPDLFGYYCTIGYGYNTASGNRSSEAAPLWVKQQFHNSKMGNVDRVIYLEGSWNLLREMKDIGSLLGATQPPYYEVDYTGVSYTIYDIIKQVLVAAGFGLYALGGEDDSIVDTLQPDFVVNAPGPIEDAATVIYRLLNMTKVFCRTEVEATSTTSGPTTVASVTHSSATLSTFARKTFWAAGRYWVFYSDGTNLVFETSTDGTTWSGSVTTVAAALGQFYAVTYDERTGKVAYTRNANGSPPETVYWRQGSPQTDGSITWDAAEQTVRSSGENYIQNVNCCFDSNGYAWVTWAEGTFGSGHPYVSKNANTDGTWADDTNFPYELSTSDREETAPVPLLDGKVYVVQLDPGDEIMGRLWSGSSWGSDETIATATVSTQSWSVVAIGNTVHYAYGVVADKKIYHTERDPSEETWSTPVEVVNLDPESPRPQLCIVNGVLHCFYALYTAKTTYGIKYDGSSWESSGTLLFTDAGALIETRLTAPYQAFNDKVLLVWMTNGSSPYPVRIGIQIVHTSSFRIKYPNGYSSYDYTYTSDKPATTDHQFREFEWRDQVIIPTHVYVLANQAADGNWDSVIVGKYELAISTNNQYPKIVEYYVASTLTTQANADNRAAAIAVRRQMEAQLGRVVVPHNCGQELYDWIKIRDKRPTGTYVDYPPTRWGNEAIVGSLTHVYDPENGKYDLEITINGIESSAPMDATIPVRPVEEELAGLEEVSEETKEIVRKLETGEERIYFPTEVPLTEYGQQRLSEQMRALIEQYGAEGLRERFLKASEEFRQTERWKEEERRWTAGETWGQREEESRAVSGGLSFRGINIKQIMENLKKYGGASNV